MPGGQRGRAQLKFGSANGLIIHNRHNQSSAFHFDSCSLLAHLHAATARSPICIGQEMTVEVRMANGEW